MATTRDRVYDQLLQAQDKALETAKQILAELCRQAGEDAAHVDDEPAAGHVDVHGDRGRRGR